VCEVRIAVNKSFKAAGVAGCLWAVLMMSGGHWMALQSLAWLRMTAEFSHQTTLRAAVAKTFSGRYPCPLCVKVQQGIQQERQQAERIPWLKSEKLPEALWQFRALSAPAVPALTAVDPHFALETYSDFVESPPTPPPRA
jgi:hypothetical protein